MPKGIADEDPLIHRIKLRKKKTENTNLQGDRMKGTVNISPKIPKCNKMAAANPEAKKHDMIINPFHFSPPIAAWRRANTHVRTYTYVLEEQKPSKLAAVKHMYPGDGSIL